MGYRRAFLNMACRQIARRQLLRTHDANQGRRRFARVARLLFRAPPLALYLPDNLSAQQHTTRALWISAGQVHPRRVIFYIHGGGFVVGSPWTHKKMLARLSRLSGLRVCAPQYRRSPEHHFPDALNDVKTAYQALLERGYDARDIVIGGDSAGGNLVFALLADLCAQGYPPRAAFAYSPWTDLTLSGESLRDNAQRDPLLPVSRIEELRGMYLGDADPSRPDISPLLAQYPDCPPVFLQVSETEILRDDTLRLAEHLRAQGACVEHQLWPDLPHVWQLFDGWLPEARQALRSTARFIARQFEERGAS